MGKRAHVTDGAATHPPPSFCVVTGNRVHERTVARVGDKPAQKDSFSAGHGGSMVLSHTRQMPLGRERPAARKKRKLRGLWRCSHACLEDCALDISSDGETEETLHERAR